MTRTQFAAAAREVTRHIQKNYWNEREGLYMRKPGDRQPEMMWGNGIMFSALVSASKQEPRVYRPIMARFFATLDRYWDTKNTPPGYEPAPTRGGGNDKYYDDNEWMVITFLEAYDLSHEAKYLDRADAALKFSLSGWDETMGGGIWWHQGHKEQTKNTCSNAPAAFACLRMAEYRRRDENTAWAKRIVAWTNANLQGEDGLFWDSKRTDGKINKDRLTYNTALMLRSNLSLLKFTNDQAYLEEAKRLNAACDWFVGADGAYRDNIRWAHLQVEADLQAFRELKDERALERARRNGELAYQKWKANPPVDLIEETSIARMLWVLAEETSF